MRLLLDMDGPLADFDGYFWDTVKELGVESVNADRYTQSRRFATDHITNPAERKFLRWMIERTRWFAELPVTDGAVEGVEALLDAGLDIWVCTKPLDANSHCRDDKAQWLRKHFPSLSDKLIIAPDKSLIRGDVLLDDAPHLGWLGRAVWRPVIFPSTYNRGGSDWGHLPAWGWGDPVHDLMRHMQ
jgi:5'-nucleotidase